MFQSILNKHNSSNDLWGAAASGLCLIHCLATPFLFTVQAGVEHHHHHHHHGDSPAWWGIIDVAFLLISLVAVYFTIQHTTRQWVKYAIAFCWVFLAFVILNEKVEMIHLAEEAIYLPAIGLIGIHLYNWKYCQCEDEECCVPNENTVLNQSK